MLGYRALFNVEPTQQGTLDLVREQLHAWMRGKSMDPDALRLDTWTKPVEHVDAIMLERTERDGSRARRARLEEHNANGTWTSQLTVLERAAESDLVWLDVINPEVREDDSGEQSLQRRRWTGTPKLARRLLDVLPARDGLARLTNRPSNVRGEEAFDLVRAVGDDSRRGPVYVAGTDDTLLERPWFDLVARLLHHTVGLGSAYVLDGEATRIFNDETGSTHGVQPGTIRTFLPGARFGDSGEALKHRVLSTSRIVEDREQRLAHILGWRARELATDKHLPTAATRLDRRFEQQIDSLLVDGAIEASSAAPHASAPATTQAAADEVVPGDTGWTEVIRALHREFGAANLTPEGIEEIARLVKLGRDEQAHRQSVSKRLAELQERNSELTDSIELLRVEHDDEILEHGRVYEQLGEANAQVRHLQRKLLEAQRPEDAWSPPDAEATWRPANFNDLLNWVGSLSNVRFVGEQDEALGLDKHDRVGLLASKTWDALVALEDYGCAKGTGDWTRDVQGYLERTPDGFRGYSANRHTRDESADVRSNPGLRQKRVFAVPPSVADEGEVFMGAHFKITQQGQISPRLHYFDDTARSGLVYVGYIGPHLPTKRTN